MLAYYTQRVVTVRLVRRCCSLLLAAWIRLRHGGAARYGFVRAAADAADTLEREGLARLPDVCQPERIEEMVRFFERQPVAGPDGRPVALEDLSPGTSMASYPLAAVVACPGLMEAINARAILQLAALYLGCKPTISSVGVRWSFPRAGLRSETQLFHRDPDDWRFLKLFIYLTDVDGDAGPHVYVTTSHKTAGTMRSRHFGREMLEARFGAENIRVVEGARGTTFMADTHGIHMGTPPLRAPRLILQVQYSILPVFAFAYAPVACPAGLVVDRYVNRLIVA